MAINNFKPFAVGAGANVMTQADYEALAALLTGFQSGTAQSQQLNKVWRQSSIMSAVLAQFIVDLTGQDAIDDGATATLLANLKMAVQAQSAAVVGQTRNLVMSVTAASTSATLTADEIVVGTALGGQKYLLKQFSNTINLATTGAGGMDTGTAPTSGNVAIYAIFNPTTGATALLAQDASTLRSNVYTGANMPSGYTASALVSVWGTNSSGQLNVGYARDRTVYGTSTQAFSTSTPQSSFTRVSFANVPVNATSVSGTILLTNDSSNNTPQGAVAASSAGVAEIDASATAVIVAGGISCPFSGLPIITPRTLYYKLSVVASGTPNLAVNISSYTI
ncbi:hypothetical protein WK22_10515 [Burkholderia multivorans]|uniref:hypothetical protein n=1 Tax=Burkholderia multivorans TaxID=87883 RepID=UPI0008417EEC|nr:hypothetical protein [Burkholderia multivorans]AOJ93306.1 hypothetical protein WK22_10515 [Burkholderia multivorans]